MSGRTDRVALGLVLVAGGVAALALGLELLGHGSTAAALGFSVAAVGAGGACSTAWARGARSDGRRLPLLLSGAVLPAFGAFALASVTHGGPWGLALDGTGVGAVAIAVLLLRRRR